MHGRKQVISLLQSLLFAVIGLQMESVNADDTPVQPCNNHCPDNSYYCLVCCQAHGYKGGKGTCKGDTCYCEI
ncbi:Toxin-like peptide AaF1CA1 [Orchesella cincta]|uniref:Toxin-like peptide AaF1CA1 n=1 Tax=Orchesella cincta TaxID=48709 RepID=A0A1D2MCI0_ORCCI|nr:Toxin-like peptide AaF1CA1 [Orchesella cincta]